MPRVKKDTNNIKESKSKTKTKTPKKEDASEKASKIKQDKAITTPPVTKVCKCCGNEKSLKEFNYWNKEKQTYMDICKDCEKERNKEKHDKKREFLNQLRSSGCVVCGERETCCLDFHHIDQEHKEFNMGSALNKTDKKIIEEAAKCVVVCSNCHRKIHAGLIDIFDYINPVQYQYLRMLVKMSQANVAIQQLSNQGSKKDDNLDLED